ncbi:hypothetical protein BGZ82_001526 [Podila clonocystis]|nr:hypothetical protein BGZ82_001526 [Podila clonocystis]
MRQSFLVPLVVVALKLTHAASIQYKDELRYGIVTVGVGASTNDLLLDTASSNTWVGANKPYQPGPNSKDTGQTVSVSYASGKFSGEEFTDDVTLGSLVVSGQSIGAARSSTGFAGVDGILGLGPVDLTNGTTSGGGLIPTITDNLFSQGTIKGNMVGIGRDYITFGGYDASETVGPVVWAPITSTFPASTFWGIDASFDYGGETILQTTAGIVDTVTALLLLATDAFQKFQKATGASPDAQTGLLTITSDQYEILKPLSFNVGGVSHTLMPNALIWPRAHNTDIGGKPDGIYLVVSDMGENSGNGLDFMIGYRALRRFYTVFDTANRKVGFAKTQYTTSTEN